MGTLISNLIIIAVLVLLLSAAGLYIYKEKKSGRRCIGCPSSGKCPKKNACCCCSGNNTNK